MGGIPDCLHQPRAPENPPDSVPWPAAQDEHSHRSIGEQHQAAQAVGPDEVWATRHQEGKVDAERHRGERSQQPHGADAASPLHNRGSSQ